MSTGKLCGAKTNVMLEINQDNPDLVVSCDLYEGHEGDHSKMFYLDIKENGNNFHSNYRLGRINWKPEQSNTN